MPGIDSILGEPQYQVSSVTGLHWLLRGGPRAAIVPALVAGLPLLREFPFRKLAAPEVPRDLGLVFRRGAEATPVADALARRCREVARVSLLPTESGFRPD